MTKLLVQGDDFGFTKGVTYGIVDAIDNGVLRNTGLFANMPEAEHAVQFMKDRPQVCFGQDFNIVSGRPCASVDLIPHLVDENGLFIRSGERLKDSRYVSEEGRRELFPFDEVNTEIHAQYERFLALTDGRKPGYLHIHSLVPETYMESIRLLSSETGIPFSVDIRKKYGFADAFTLAGKGIGASLKKKAFDPIAQLNKDTLGMIQSVSDGLLQHEYAVISCHPGFLDSDLLRLTTLSIGRINDQKMMTSEWIKKWIADNKIQLITYDDL